MPRSGGRRPRADRQQVKRRRAAHAAAARRTQRAQASAATRRGPAEWWRHPLAYVCWCLAAAAGFADLLVYLGALDVMTAATATVVLGLPAAVLIVVGAIVYGT